MALHRGAGQRGSTASDEIRSYYERLLIRPADPPWLGLELPDGTPIAPTIVGPTWQVGEDGNWLLPERTLGWQVLIWCGEWLQARRGVPWQFTAEQARWLLWWFAVDDDGDFTYRDGVLQRLKGWGKDPLGACLSAVELVGPCRVNTEGLVDQWGDPIGVEHEEAWIQCAAVSKDQTKNTMRLFPALFTPEAKREFSLQVLKEIVYAYGGERMIDAVTSSPATLEGARATFVLKNETQHWFAVGDGHEMADVIERNATKSEDGSARTLSITNAPEPGLDSTAERERDAYEAVAAGLAHDTGLLYDSIEAPPNAPLSVAPLEGESVEDHLARTKATLSVVILCVRGDATWLNVRRIVKSIIDRRNPPSRSRRYWYNQIVAAEDSWLARAEWDRVAMATDLLVNFGDQITLGFDGSKSDDHSALIACHVDTGHLFQIKVWTPNEHTGEVDRHDIDATVRATFELYDVVGFFSDLHPWESYVDAWAEELGGKLCVKASQTNAVAFDMRSRQAEFVPAIESFHDAILEETQSHCGSKAFSQHAYNCRRLPGRFGVTVWKGHRESPRKIDAIPAATLARLCRQRYVALPKSRKRRLRTGKASFL